MGDAGSIPLGFLAGSLGLVGIWRGAWPAWFPLLAFAPFVLDASATLARRALEGKPVWQAHREHLYQRMVQSRYGHRGMTSRWALVMGVGGLLSVVLLNLPAGLQWGAVLSWLTFLCLLGYRIAKE